MRDERQTTARRLTWRTAEPEDAIAVGKALDDWWEKRLHHCVQPQLFEHFGDTTLIFDGVAVHHDVIGIGGDYVMFSMDLRTGPL